MLASDRRYSFEIALGELGKIENDGNVMKTPSFGETVLTKMD